MPEESMHEHLMRSDAKLAEWLGQRAVSSELHDEAANCRRMAAEYNQKPEATNSPADQNLYKFLGDRYAELAEAYEAAAAR
jgi:hypothetical protein